MSKWFAEDLVPNASVGGAAVCGTDGPVELDVLQGR